MNKSAIAIASDSAVTLTIGNQSEKIFTSAHKIYTLSKYYPVGIMVYNDTSFMDIPWETIIKKFRNQLSDKSYDRLEQYAEKFFEFLKNDIYSFSAFAEHEYVKTLIYDYFLKIRMNIELPLKYHLEKENKLTEEIIDSIVNKISPKVIDSYYSTWKNEKFISSVPNDNVKYLKNKYTDLIEILKIEVFQSIELNEDDWEKLTAIATFLFTRFPKHMFNPIEDFFHDLTTGVVIMGFGKEDLFPKLKSYLINGIINNHLMYRTNRYIVIDRNCRSIIVPFAQCEMVHSFMQGIVPDQYIFISNKINKLIKEFMEDFVNGLNLNNDDKILMKTKMKLHADNFNKKFLYEWRNERSEYSEKITKVVSHLPKMELALMAKTLVNLTSFKRKVSLESETVSDPIDVAIISKGDGFVWIERKHYFKPEFNSQFFKNYNHEEG